VQRRAHRRNPLRRRLISRRRIECDIGDDYRGAVSIDLRAFDRVVEIDRTSRAARIQAGVYGPALEDQLRPHGLTLRHFPQSFEFSTLGGWLATRSGGHYATLHTHIDDFVESIRAITPHGIWESRRLPGSGAGPSPDRMLLGSEGILGVITEAWMRLQDRPTYRASATARFPDFAAAVEGARAVAQAGLYPSNCRLLDPVEALVSGTDTSGDAILLLAFESADHPLDAWIARAVECARDHHGKIDDDAIVLRSASDAGAREGAAGNWRNAFIRAPTRRDALAALGVISETFETACTWDAFGALHEGVIVAVQEAAKGVDIAAPAVTCRFTHVYPDGPAPYFTVLALGREPDQLAQWDAIKAAAGEALMRHGGTITHHHAVGRDHRPWYDVQRRTRSRPRCRPPNGRSIRGRAQPRRAHRSVMPIRAVIFDLGGVVFRRRSKRSTSTTTATISPRHDARPHPQEQRGGRVGRARTGRAHARPVHARARSGSRCGRLPPGRRRLMALIGSSLGPRPEMAKAIERIRAHGRRTAALTNNWTDDDARSTPHALHDTLAFDVVVESSREGLRNRIRASTRSCSLVSTCSRPRRCSSTISASISNPRAPWA